MYRPSKLRPTLSPADNKLRCSMCFRSHQQQYYRMLHPLDSHDIRFKRMLGRDVPPSPGVIGCSLRWPVAFATSGVRWMKGGEPLLRSRQTMKQGPGFKPVSFDPKSPNPSHALRRGIAFVRISCVASCGCVRWLYAERLKCICRCAESCAACNGNLID